MEVSGCNGNGTRQFKLFKHLLQQMLPDHLWHFQTAKELIPWFWSGTQKLSGCPLFQVLSSPGRTAAIKGGDRKLLGTEDEESAHPYHRLLTLRSRGVNETSRELTAWSSRGTLVLGSSFWSFSNRVLSGTPKSLFSTIETRVCKPIWALIQV